MANFCPRFRAWHKELKQMRDIISIDFEMQYCDVDLDMINREQWLFDEIELMQWTGLQDKNGKDIYEGDIVETSADALWHVLWQEDMARFIARLIPYGSLTTGQLVSALVHMSGKIIGNAYENSELLSHV